MSEKSRLSTSVGALADPLDEQLRQAGIADFDEAAVKRLQDSLDCIIRLRIQDILPDREADKLIRKVIDRLGEAIEGGSDD